MMHQGTIYSAIAGEKRSQQVWKKFLTVDGEVTVHALDGPRRLTAFNRVAIANLANSIIA
jgi:hypothetical protein